MCSMIWTSRDEFIMDKNLKLNGYQVDFENLTLGLFFFTHTIPGCHTTLALRVEHFLDLHPGPKYKALDVGGENCPGYCRKTNEVRQCNNSCQGVYVRDIMAILRDKSLEFIVGK